ncbi:MAG: hypothetical protein M3Q65_07965, partial [Chloroflexota bacterium]|nr:hypothetical protein [Chloroflexota bacterium]
GALAAALTAGALAHYFFHIGFSHMVALFWALLALALVAAKLALAREVEDSRVAGRRSGAPSKPLPSDTAVCSATRFKSG